MDTLEHSGRKLHLARKWHRAFSLIEVTLSIGIVSFAFVGIFGLIPTGMATFSRAMDASVGAQIAQRVIADAHQTDFDLLVQKPNDQTIVKALRYFDDQGTEVIPVNATSLTATEKQKIVYWVNTRVAPATELPLAAASTGNAALATVTVQVANDPGNQPPTSDATTKLWRDNRFSINAYSALVSQNQ